MNVLSYILSDDLVRKLQTADPENFRLTQRCGSFPIALEAKLARRAALAIAAMEEKSIAAIEKDVVFDESSVSSGMAITPTLAVIRTVLLNIGVNQFSHTKKANVSLATTRINPKTSTSYLYISAHVSLLMCSASKAL